MSRRFILQTVPLVALALTIAGCAEPFQIRSYPGGARALIDGRVIGPTPAEVSIPRSQVGLPHTWRVEYRNCDYAEGNLQTGIAPGRIVTYILTAGIFALIRGPYYYPDIDAMLTGGDCEPGQARSSPPAQPGILIQNIVGDKNQAGVISHEDDPVSGRFSHEHDPGGLRVFSRA
jgi:hypothetical protein